MFQSASDQKKIENNYTIYIRYYKHHKMDTLQEYMKTMDIDKIINGKIDDSLRREIDDIVRKNITTIDINCEQLIENLKKSGIVSGKTNTIGETTPLLKK